MRQESVMSTADLENDDVQMYRHIFDLFHEGIESINRISINRMNHLDYDVDYEINSSPSTSS